MPDSSKMKERIKTFLSPGNDFMIAPTSEPTNKTPAKLKRIEGESIFIDYLFQSKEEAGEFVANSGDKFLLFYHADDALYEMPTQCFSVEKYADAARLELAFPTTAERVQRREYYRLALGQRAIIRNVNRIDSSGKDVFTSRGDDADCIILNISGGGLRVLTNLVIEGDGYFQVEFDLNFHPEKEHINEVLQVRAVQDTKGQGSGTYTFAYGGEFYGLRKQVREVIIRFIHMKQVEERQRQEDAR